MKQSAIMRSTIVKCWLFIMLYWIGATSSRDFQNPSRSGQIMPISSTGHSHNISLVVRHDGAYSLPNSTSSLSTSLVLRRPAPILSHASRITKSRMPRTIKTESSSNLSTSKPSPPRPSPMLQLSNNAFEIAQHAKSKLLRHSSR